MRERLADTKKTGMVQREDSTKKDKELTADVGQAVQYAKDTSRMSSNIEEAQQALDEHNRVNHSRIEAKVNERVSAVQDASARLMASVEQSEHNSKNIEGEANKARKLLFKSEGFAVDGKEIVKTFTGIQGEYQSEAKAGLEKLRTAEQTKDKSLCEMEIVARLMTE